MIPCAVGGSVMRGELLEGIFDALDVPKGGKSAPSRTHAGFCLFIERSYQRGND